MPEFVCRAGTPGGVVVERSVIAESPSAARRELEGDGLAVFQVQRSSAGGAAGWLERLRGLGARILPSIGSGAGGLSVGRRRLKERDLFHFTQELAALIGAGLPVLKCLDILRPRRRETVAGPMLERVRERVAAGAALADAFEPEIEEMGIPPLFVTTLEIGEASGDLESVLRRYADHLERSQELKSKVRGALIYPSALLAVSVIVIVLLMVVVVPRFADFYASYDAELPMTTRVLIGAAGAVTGHPWLILTGLAAVAAGAWLLNRTARGRRTLERWSLEVPLAGRLNRLHLDVETCRTLATLLRGGATLIRALEVTAGGARNASYRARLRAVEERLREGASLHRAMEENGLLDDLGLEMVQVGESTGSLDDMLEHVAGTYDETLSRRLDTLVGLVEPALLVFMGVFVAGILLALYLPLFNVVQVI